MFDQIRKLALQRQLHDLETQRDKAEEEVDHYQKLSNEFSKKIQKLEDEIWAIDEAEFQQLLQG